MLQVSTEVQSSLALFDRIFEYLDLPHEIQDAPDAVAIDDVTGHVRLRDVRFRYEEPPEGIPVSPDAPPLGDDDPVPREWTLDGVDLDIRPGQLAALVGPSGAGKTTVTYLVPRLYDVQEGSVEIDDLDVRKIKLESLGEAIGVVTQETYLFHDTVRRNLQYGKPDATDEELIAAARAANIHDRIAELPEGYDTVVGERGYKLSGRREAAARDRPRGPEGSEDPDPRRGHVVAGHDLRASRPVGAGAADEGPDDDRDRAPPLHDPVGRRDLRDRPGADRRAGDARRAAGARAGCTRSSTSSSSAAAWCRPSTRTA